MPFCVRNKKTKKTVRRFGSKGDARKFCAQLNRLNPRLFTVKRCR